MPVPSVQHLEELNLLLAAGSREEQNRVIEAVPKPFTCVRCCSSPTASSPRALAVPRSCWVLGINGTGNRVKVTRYPQCRSPYACEGHGITVWKAPSLVFLSTRHFPYNSSLYTVQASY